ncbi:hypothetical protein [Nannocystis punicea]|uniref:Uncharacterized protein n=1 Tax=Nannocystis punicea TaxID=2995304 RepID=A0ABY7H7P8_9BACT|nr:hypothetical protein [Nannocystis poenicansa]WAS95286.1 hypothetical protein O0S08_03930 [Nannocystis poenicansa]
MADPKTDLQTFVTHVLKGARFEGHSVPLSVLPDFTAYRDLVLEIARALFFRDHPERQRVPKGFEESFDLVLRSIGEGSAVAPLERRIRPNLSVVPSQLPLLNARAPDYFEQARDVANKTIEAMRTNTPAPANFPLEAVRYFNSFGRTLRDDESIEILGPDKSNTAIYTKKVRKRLVLLRESTYEDAVEITGHIVHFDTQKRTFGLLDGEQTITGSLDGLSEEQLRTIRTAAVHTEVLSVRASGTGAFDSLDRLVRLVTIKDLTFAEDENLREELDVDKRLAELADLGEGWFDGSGAPIPPRSLEWLASSLKRAEAGGLQRPYLYPTPEGMVQAEWSFPGAEVSALFDADSNSVSCVGVHTKSGAHRDEDISLLDTSGIERLISFVGRFTP